MLFPVLEWLLNSRAVFPSRLDPHLNHTSKFQMLNALSLPAREENTFSEIPVREEKHYCLGRSQQCLFYFDNLEGADSNG